MKTIRNIAIVAGVSLALFALSSTTARAAAITSTSFVGTFTLPGEAHWGALTLPAGDYSLRYGNAFGSTYLVTVADKAEQRILGMFLAARRNDVKAAENMLDCVRQGDILYVRALEMPLIGEAIHFKIPHGVEVESTLKFVTKYQNKNTNTQLAEADRHVELVPIKLSAK